MKFDFRFANGDDVVLTHNKRAAVVVACAVHIGGEVKYLCQAVDGTGASWANEGALEVPSPADDEKADA